MEETVEQLQAEVVQDSEEQSPVQLEAFVYPKFFDTEYAGEIQLPSPVSRIEKRVFASVAKLVLGMPGNHPIMRQLRESMSLLDPEAGLLPVDDDIEQALNLVASALTVLPEQAIDIMHVMTGMTIEEVEEKLTIAQDGVRLFALFIRLEASRLGRSADSLQHIFGAMPMTLGAAGGVSGDSSSG